MIDPPEIAYGTGYSQSAKISESDWPAGMVPKARVHSGIFLAIALAAIIYSF